MTRHYFFSRASAAWLGPLREARFFPAPPEPVIDDGSVTLPSWPETEYLIRVVADDADGALEAARGVPVTDNSRVTSKLVQIALACRRTGRWTWPTRSPPLYRGRYGVLAPEPMGALVAHLVPGGHHDQAMNLARALLAAPPPRRGRGAEVMDGYAYAEILRGATTALAAAGGVSWLRFLVELLGNAIAEELAAGRRERTSYDGSLGWRPAIEAADTPSEDDPRNSLTDAIRTTAQHLVQSDIATVDAWPTCPPFVPRRLAVLDQWLTNEPGYWRLARRGELLRSIIASGAAAGEAEAALARKLVSILLERHGMDLRDSLGPPPVDAPANEWLKRS